MMKLILSLTLIWTLSSTAEALQCWHGEGDDTKRSSIFPCDSLCDMCATVATKVYTNGKLSQTVSRRCIPSSHSSVGTHTLSYKFSYSTATASVHVCNTDGCNNQTIPYPEDQKPSTMLCYSCKDESSTQCDKLTLCKGVQNHCISGTMEDYKGATVNLVGCASANICSGVSQFKFLPLPGNITRQPKCCRDTLCNSAWSVKLNVMTLLFGLITLICY